MATNSEDTGVGADVLYPADMPSMEVAAVVHIVKTDFGSRVPAAIIPHGIAGMLPLPFHPAADRRSCADRENPGKAISVDSNGTLRDGVETPHR